MWYLNVNGILKTDMKPLVTIVMPIYNVARYVERALVSALNQTYTNLEIICVDDCGRDNSMEIVERVQKLYDKNSKMRIIHHDHNRANKACQFSSCRRCCYICRFTFIF